MIRTLKNVVCTYDLLCMMHIGVFESSGENKKNNTFWGHFSERRSARDFGSILDQFGGPFRIALGSKV